MKQCFKLIYYDALDELALPESVFILCCDDELEEMKREIIRILRGSHGKASLRWSQHAPQIQKVVSEDIESLPADKVLVELAFHKVNHDENEAIMPTAVRLWK